MQTIYKKTLDNTSDQICFVWAAVNNYFHICYKKYLVCIYRTLIYGCMTTFQAQIAMTGYISESVHAFFSRAVRADHFYVFAFPIQNNTCIFLTAYD